MNKSHSRLGKFGSTDLLFILLIFFIIVSFVLVGIESFHKYNQKKEFYLQNGYVEIKYNNGIDMWIKKTDINLINITPEK